MSEFMFGSGKGDLKMSYYKRIDEIAGRHGATIHNPNLPGSGPTYWFSGPNRGDPFDRAMREAVFSDLERAGLWREGEGLLDKCFVGERRRS